jgi:hypothetical protein
MGIEYYVYHPKKKKLFELGKGFWSNFDFAQCLEPKTLGKYILDLHKEDDTYFVSSEGEDGFDKEYAEEIAQKLLKFIGDCPLDDLRVVNDCGGHDEECSCDIEDGRYHGYNDEEIYPVDHSRLREIWNSHN